MARQTVEGTKYIDVQAVINLDDGTIYKAKLNRTHKRHFIVKRGNQVTIDTTKLFFSTTKTGFGMRKWFCCPGCGTNTKKLYLPEGEKVWACWKCHELTYQKSQLSGNDIRYVTYRIRELQDELQVSKDNSWPCLGLVDANIDWLPIFKPKHMHWKTFEIKRQLLEILILKRNDLWFKTCKF